MRTILNIIIIAVLSYVAHLYIPIWWFFALISFSVCFAFSKAAWNAFYTSFLAVFGLWFALVVVGSAFNDFLLVSKMTDLIGLPHSSVLMLLSAFIGGLVSGLAGLSGYFLKTYSVVNNSPSVQEDIELTDVEEIKND